MKAVYLHAAGAIALTFSIAACVPQAAPPAPTPTPVAQPTPTPAPAPPIVREPVFDNYLDAPQTQGTWYYMTVSGGPMAAFGTDPQNADFIIRCTGPRIALARKTSRVPTADRAMTIQTETQTRNLAASPATTGLVAAGLDPRDPLLDAMAITKGRIAIGVEGERTLYLPAWVEISRVIEDCR